MQIVRSVAVVFALSRAAFAGSGVSSMPAGSAGPGLLVQEGVASAAPTPEELDWLRAHALPFTTCEPESGFEDLAPLAALIGDARIVALGEGTHGTREFFQMKHRLVEYLASELGFTIFSIEASTPEAYELDAYVLGGPGDPEKLIGGMYFWTWNTEEVLALVEWMRVFNASGEKKIHFTGFDMQTPDVAMEIVSSFLAGVDPGRAEEVRAQYAQAKGAQAPAGFGVATGSFPVESARGKRVRFSGWIKTEALVDGWAGLWWRNDGPNGEPRGFDNMSGSGRAPRGTQDWTEVALELDVPEDTQNINFGCLMPGAGKAWFDGLAIELDGEPFVDAERFDLDFEGGIRGFSSFAAGYNIHTDTTAHAGAKSLCIETFPRDPSALDAGAAAKLAREILEELEDGRELLLAERDVAEVEWAIHNARIVDQCMRSRSNSFNVRDQSMAENVAWILEQNPGARIVLWAHNGHVQRAASAMMGAHLARKFGDDYLPIGFATEEGRYTAVGERGLADHPLQPSPPGCIESRFTATGAPRLFLDLRSAEKGSAGSGWLRERRPFRSIGALAQEEQFFPTVLANAYDILVYVRTTTPTVQLATAPGRRR
jgi:erythromycin esterase-like protein